MKPMKSMLLGSLFVMFFGVISVQAQNPGIKPEKRNAFDFMMQYQKAYGAEVNVTTLGEIFESLGEGLPEQIKPIQDVSIYRFDQDDVKKGGLYAGFMVKLPDQKSVKATLEIIQEQLAVETIPILIQGNSLVIGQDDAIAFKNYSWAFRTGGYPELYEAIRQGQLDKIKAFQAAGLEMKQARFTVPAVSLKLDEEGELILSDSCLSNMNALHLAAYFGQIKVLDYLLAQGFKLQSTCSFITMPDEYLGTKGFYEGVSILSVAALSEEKAMALYLIHKGVDLNSKDDGGFPVIMDIAIWGEIEVLKAAIKKGADPKAIYTETGESILHFANFDAEIVAFLLKSGADAKVVDKLGVTTLMASGGQDIEVVKLLVKAGADPKRLDQQGQNVYFYDCSFEAAEFFFDQGVSLKVVNNNGETPLFYVWESLMAEAMILAGVDAKLKNKDGLNAYEFHKQMDADQELLYVLKVAIRK